MVPMDADVSVRHVVDIVEILALFRYFQTAKLLIVAEIGFTCRIAYLDSVDDVPIVVKPGYYRSDCDAPRAVRIAGKIDRHLSYSTIRIVGGLQYLVRIW